MSQRQVYGHVQATVRSCGRAHVATMGVGHRPDNRQTQPRTARAGELAVLGRAVRSRQSSEGFKQAVHLRRGDQ